jgi:hypothetical protein
MRERRLETASCRSQGEPPLLDQQVSEDLGCTLSCARVRHGKIFRPPGDLLTSVDRPHGIALAARTDGNEGEHDQ